MKYCSVGGCNNETDTKMTFRSIAMDDTKTVMTEPCMVLNGFECSPATIAETDCRTTSQSNRRSPSRRLSPKRHLIKFLRQRSSGASSTSSTKTDGQEDHRDDCNKTVVSEPCTIQTRQDGAAEVLLEQEEEEEEVISAPPAILRTYRSHSPSFCRKDENGDDTKTVGTEKEPLNQNGSPLALRRSKSQPASLQGKDEDMARDDCKTVVSEPCTIQTCLDGAAEVLLEKEQEQSITSPLAVSRKARSPVTPFGLPSFNKRLFRSRNKNKMGSGSTANKLSSSSSSSSAYGRSMVHAREDGAAEVLLPDTHLTDSIAFRRSSTAPSPPIAPIVEPQQQQQQIYHLSILQGQHLPHPNTICRVLAMHSDGTTSTTAKTTTTTTTVAGETLPGLVDSVNAHGTIYGGPPNTFSIRGTPLTKICIQLVAPTTALSAAYPLPRVEFTVDQVLGTAKGGSKMCPNRWVTLQQADISNPVDEKTPNRAKEKAQEANEQDQDPVPRLQIRLIQTSRSIHRCRSDSTWTQKNLEWHCRTPVRLNVYDLSKDERVQDLNDCLKPMGMGGVFHTSVEVYGREYSFGGSSSLPPERKDSCGIYKSNPKQCHGHHFRESIFLGNVELTERQVRAILRDMKTRWIASSYSVFRKNCCHFARDLAIELGVGDVPKWTYCLAETVEPLEPVLRGIADNKPQPPWSTIGDDVLGDSSSLVSPPVLADVLGDSSSSVSPPALAPPLVSSPKGQPKEGKIAGDPHVPRLARNHLGKMEHGLSAASKMQRSLQFLRKRPVKVSTIADCQHHYAAKY